jgi:hypothetical protein
VIARPGIFPILYGHHFRKGIGGLLKAAYIEPYAFLAGMPTRRLYYLKRDTKEQRSVYRAEQETAQKLQDLLRALDKRTGAGSASDRKTSTASEDEEAKIEAHLRELGYVED